MHFNYRAASIQDLERIWDSDIQAHGGDERWIAGKAACLVYNRNGLCRTFVVACDDGLIGQGSLYFSPESRTINGRTELADGARVAHVSALKIEKAFEGQGHISRLMRLMEAYACERGYETLTIGVDAKETRNLAVYLHWGYDRYINHMRDHGALVLYYAKKIQPQKSCLSEQYPE